MQTAVKNPSIFKSGSIHTFSPKHFGFYYVLLQCEIIKNVERDNVVICNVVT
jgi:hypothetical protein